MGLIEGHQAKTIEIQELNHGLKHKNQTISRSLPAEVSQKSA